MVYCSLTHKSHYMKNVKSSSTPPIPIIKNQHRPIPYAPVVQILLSCSQANPLYRFVTGIKLDHYAISELNTSIIRWLFKRLHYFYNFLHADSYYCTLAILLRKTKEKVSVTPIVQTLVYEPFTVLPNAEPSRRTLLLMFNVMFASYFNVYHFRVTSILHLMK